MITPLGFFNGFTGFLVTLLAFAVIYYDSYIYFKKEKNQLLISLILAAIAIGLGWTGTTITFFSVAIFQTNLPGVEILVPFFSFFPIPIGAIAFFNIAWNIAWGSGLKGKKKVLYAYLMLIIVYYIVFFLTFSSSVGIYGYPDEVIDTWLLPTSITYYLVWIFIIIDLIVGLVGLISIWKMTSGEWKKKSFALIITVILVGLGVLLDTVILIGDSVQIITSLPRIIMLIAWVIIPFYGFRRIKSKRVKD